MRNCTLNLKKKIIMQFFFSIDKFKFISGRVKVKYEEKKINENLSVKTRFPSLMIYNESYALQCT